MLRVIFGPGLMVILLALALAATGQVTQAPTSQSPPQPTPATKLPRVQGLTIPPPAKPPDMVCFGHGPDWSIQFSSGQAQYLGAKEPDRYFLGDFYWVPEVNSWSWHRQDGLAPTTGKYGLSANIQEGSCKDSASRQMFPYSAQVNLPQGDIVHGCCRKLKPGEAPLGPNGRVPATPKSP